MRSNGGGGAGVHLRISAFPLFDPPRRLALHGQRHNTVPPHAAPRIVVPGLTEPHAPPATAIARRSHQRHPASSTALAALAAALDDLPAQARRFARWKAARDAQYARNPAAPRRLFFFSRRSAAAARPAGACRATTPHHPSPDTPRSGRDPGLCPFPGAARAEKARIRRDGTTTSGFPSRRQPPLQGGVAAMTLARPSPPPGWGRSPRSGGRG